MKIAFDITGTLLRLDATETESMINLLKILKKAGHYIIVWSGSEINEINEFIESKNLSEYVDLAVCKTDVKPKDFPDIAFDDSQFAFLAKKATIKV